MPEGEEKEQDIENLFEQIIKENFPNLVKEIDFQRIPKNCTQGGTQQGTS